MSAARVLQPEGLHLDCGECDGAGEVVPALARAGSPWVRPLRCGECDGGGRVEARCWCGVPAVTLVLDGEPVCGTCAEDFIQGPVSLEDAPWQQDDITTEEAGS